MPPFPRITYDEAIEMPARRRAIRSSGATTSAATRRPSSPTQFDRPVMVTRYPAGDQGVLHAARSRRTPRWRSALDMLAPEGYGEIIGGSQRIHDHDLLLQRIQEHNLPVEAFQWYLDVRKYGTFPHSGFGMGIERFVAWMCGAAAPARDDPLPADAVQDLPLGFELLPQRDNGGPRCGINPGLSR